LPNHYNHPLYPPRLNHSIQDNDIYSINDWSAYRRRTSLTNTSLASNNGRFDLDNGNISNPMNVNDRNAINRARKLSYRNYISQVNTL
jgi:hypothetical protein